MDVTLTDRHEQIPTEALEGSNREDGIVVKTWDGSKGCSSPRFTSV